MNIDLMNIEFDAYWIDVACVGQCLFLTLTFFLSSSPLSLWVIRTPPWYPRQLWYLEEGLDSAFWGAGVAEWVRRQAITPKVFGSNPT